MNKHIIRAVIGYDESKPFLRIEPLDGPRCDAIRKTPNAERSVDRKFIYSRETAGGDSGS